MIKNFKVATSEHHTKGRVILSTGPHVCIIRKGSPVWRFGLEYKACLSSLSLIRASLNREWKPGRGGLQGEGWSQLFASALPCRRTRSVLTLHCDGRESSVSLSRRIPIWSKGEHEEVGGGQT